MLDASPESIIPFPLIPMAQFNRTLGPIPVEFGGGNRYRVIWAPSRKIMRFVTGTAEIIAAYGRNGVEPLPQQVEPGLKAGECWILEQWCNPYRDCTEKAWNTIQCLQVPNCPGLFTKLQVMGPFPRRGYYWRCDNTYLYGEPTSSAVEREILLVEDGMFRHTQWDNFVAIRKREEKGEKGEKSLRDAMINDRMLIGGGEAYSSGHGRGRGTKTINTSRTDRDLNRIGISTRRGTASVTPRRRKLTYDMSPYIR